MIKDRVSCRMIFQNHLGHLLNVLNKYWMLRAKSSKLLCHLFLLYRLILLLNEAPHCIQELIQIGIALCKCVDQVLEYWCTQ